MIGCAEARRRLSSHLDGELAVSDRQQVDEHLAVCPDCCDFSRALARDDAALAGDAEPRWADDATDVLVERLRGRCAAGGVGAVSRTGDVPGRPESQALPGWRIPGARAAGWVVASAMAVAALLVLVPGARERVTLPISRSVDRPPESSPAAPAAPAASGAVPVPTGPIQREALALDARIQQLSREIESFATLARRESAIRHRELVARRFTPWR
jgi:anti-sigma factor RsiW